MNLSLSHGVGLVLLASSVFACRPTSGPRSFERANAVSESPSVELARKAVPEAVGRADRLRDEARDLDGLGRDVEASVVSEQAEVAYRHALAIMAGLDAERRLHDGETEVARATEELARLDAEQQKLAADADALERKAQVLLALEPGSDVEKLSGERAIARRKAALELSVEAHALCTIAKLLDPKFAGLDALLTRSEQLRAELKVGAISKDIFPTATTLRNDCLQAVTSIRRPLTQKAPEDGLPDRLHRALTETGKFFTFKDDRGIVVSLRASELGGATLSETATSQLTLLAKVGLENKSFPVLVVVHSGKKGQEKTSSALLERVTTHLEKNGLSNVARLDAGYGQPVVNPRLQGADERNARVEIVFASPTL